MALTSSAVSQADAQGYSNDLGVAQSVFAIAELMVVLDATVLAVALVDLDAAPEVITDQSTRIAAPVGTEPSGG